MKYTLILRYFINGMEPAFFTAEEGEITETDYAGQGMWVEPQGIFDSIEEALDEAEKKFTDAGCNFKRTENMVKEDE